MRGLRWKRKQEVEKQKSSYSYFPFSVGRLLRGKEKCSDTQIIDVIWISK